MWNIASIWQVGKGYIKHTVMKTNESQASRILKYLQEGNGITPIDALNLFGCFRLGARIADLKKRGYAIDKVMVKVGSGKRVARYHLAV